MTATIVVRCSVFAFACVAIAESTAVGQCRAADAQTVNMIRYLQELVTASASDSEHVAKRRDYHLPAVAAAQVTLVSTATICNSALRAYTALLPTGTPAPTSIYLVAVGTGYVAWIPAAAGTEWASVVSFDSKFHRLESWAG